MLLQCTNTAMPLFLQTLLRRIRGTALAVVLSREAAIGTACAVQWLLCLLPWYQNLHRTTIRSTENPSGRRCAKLGGKSSLHLLISPPSPPAKKTSPESETRLEFQLSGHWKNCSSCYWNCDFWFLRGETQLVDSTFAMQKTHPERNSVV